MEKKKDIKGILLVVFIVISIVLAGFIVYDKFIKSNNNEDCTDTGCYFSIDSDIKQLYVNEFDKESYLYFYDSNKTWVYNRNECHGYWPVSGTYTIEGDKVILNYPEGGKAVLEIQSDKKLRSNLVEFADENDDFIFSGCAGSEYFVEMK